MKTKIYIKTAIFTLMGGLVLLSSSCLKDSRYVNYFADAPLAEFPLAEVNAYQPGGSDGAYQAITFPATNANDTITVAVKVAAPRALTSATVFTISTTDVTALNSFNSSSGGTALLPVPATDFTVIGGLQVTVPANITEVYFKVVVNGAFVAANATGAYVLPLTIENAGSVQIAIPEKYLLYNLFAQ